MQGIRRVRDGGGLRMLTVESALVLAHQGLIADAASDRHVPLILRRAG